MGLTCPKGIASKRLRPCGRWRIAVAWKLIDENPARCGVPNPGRRCREQRPFANGRVKHPKTRLSRRAVPLQAIALEAIGRLRPRPESALLFQSSRGAYVDFRNFNRREWKPVQRTVGIESLRDLYDLRHTYATFALRAGLPVFALSRFMGTSIAMIDLHYGHLAVDSYQHAAL